MTLGPRAHTLPIAPLAAPPRRHLPLATDVRAIDAKYRPIYAVWEITLRCDLACRQCGSRAGRERPEELSTAEALDLARQMAELGVLEVTLIGGEAYVRPATEVSSTPVLDAAAAPDTGRGPIAIPLYGGFIAFDAESPKN